MVDYTLNPGVEKYLDSGCGRCPLFDTPQCKVNDWQDELKQLRRIVLECGLMEEVKWSVPCYTYDGKNILIVSALKESANISFFKGVLLKDEQKLLMKPGANTQSDRYFKFTNTQQIMDLEPIIKSYIFEAIEIERAGIKVEFIKNPEPIPEELQLKLNNDPVFKAAFENLTPGRQRGYILHFSQPKQSKTRISRIEKCIPKILAGKGFHDR